jgi:hypothetical protein
MALRNKLYVEEGRNAPPVSVPPTEAAKLPEPVADSKPPEPMVESSAADEAGKAALKQRLQEMERAEQLTRQAPQHPQHATEPQQQQPPAMPAHVEKWLAEHPCYMDPNDQVAQAEIYTATLKCSRDGKSWDQPDFIPTLERHLGIAPRTNGQTQHRPAPPVSAPSAPRSEPVRQQQRSAAPVSAPPTRDVPSMSTGRAASRPTQLTADQLEMARASGITAEEYQRQLEKMNRMKAAGELDDRRR